MKKAIFETFGKASEVVSIIETDKPGAPGTDQITVALIATPINPSDLLTTEALYGTSQPKLPSGVGKEAIGKIIAAGSAVDQIKEGDTVYFSLGDDTWAEYHNVDAGTVIPVPADIDPLQLCMCVGNPMSASLMLSEFVNLRAGDWFIQNAANSGVGVNAIKLAKLRGLKSINVVRRPAAKKAVLDAGGDHVLLESEVTPAAIRDLIGDATLSLGLDAIGGESTQVLASVLSDHGVVVNYGLLSGENCQVAAQLTVFHDISLRGFWLQPWFQTAQPEKVGSVLGEIFTALASGKLSVPIAGSFPLAEVTQALQQTENYGREGKVILTGPGYSG